jgi:hypothetical protein
MHQVISRNADEEPSLMLNSLDSSVPNDAKKAKAALSAAEA